MIKFVKFDPKDSPMAHGEEKPDKRVMPEYQAGKGIFTDKDDIPLWVLDLRPRFGAL